MNQALPIQFLHNKGYYVLNKKNQGVFGYWDEIYKKVVLVTIFKNREGQILPGKKSKTRRNEIRFTPDIIDLVVDVIRKVYQGVGGEVVMSEPIVTTLPRGEGSIVADQIRKIGV